MLFQKMILLKAPKSNFYYKTHSFFKIFENDHEAEKCRFGDHLGTTWEAFGGHVGRLGRPLEASGSRLAQVSQLEAILRLS